MITFGKTGLTLSAAVVRALLAFVHPDRTIKHLNGLGIDEGDVCATDGHAAIRFERVDIESGAAAPTSWNRRVFSRATIEAAIKARKKPADPIVLGWDALEPDHVRFANLSNAEPKDGVSADDLPIAFNPELLGRLEVAAKACRREKEAGELTAPALPAVVLTSLGDHLDPCRYSIGGEHWDTAVHAAFVTIMPMNMRAKGLTQDAKTLEAAREKVEKRRVSEERKAKKAAQAKLDRERAKAAIAEGKAVEKRNREQRQPAVSAPADVASVSQQLATVAGLREDERTKVELAFLSAPKLAEPWSGRDAQKQVLSNVLRGREVTREQRARIAERMAGRPLADLRFIVAEVLGEVCSMCGPGHRGDNGLCQRHGKRVEVAA